MSMPQKLSLFGVTGSIGRNCVDVIKQSPEQWQVETVAAGQNVRELAAAAKSLSAKQAIIADEARLSALQQALDGSGILAAAGKQALIEAGQKPTDVIINAVVGVAGLPMTWHALKGTKRLALANKESLVVAGQWIMSEATKNGVEIIPIDSEHSGALQLLRGQKKQELSKLVLTASGGPFLRWSRERMASATPAEACRHPKWSMGNKISVDSATLMNKGLELLEASHLFDLDASQLDVLVHPQAVVHALAHWCDGQVTAHVASADMRHAIAYALHYPERAPFAPDHLNMSQIGTWEFEQPDRKKFPALTMAEAVLAQVGEKRDYLGCILNAANEHAVQSFLQGQLGFAEIAICVENALEKVPQKIGTVTLNTLEAVDFVDHESREHVRAYKPRMHKVAT